jgi:photosystem II stability/assembly factor-like uncharacterized protein
VSEERLAVEIRDAFDQDYEPNRGLEDRVVAAIPWEEPRRRTLSRPRLAGAFAGALAIVMIGVLVTPTLLSRLNITGSSGVLNRPAYSLASVSSDSLFVVLRDLERPDSVLLQSRDGGRSWSARMRFVGVYDGMEMFGQDGYIWSIDLGGTNCGALDQSCRPHPPTSALALYHTSDGGSTWTMLPANGIPTGGVYFLDALHGWIDSTAPEAGLGHDVLYATTDGGKSWNLIGPLPQSATMSWVYGVGNYRLTFSRDASGELRGWYIGNGVLFTTTDAGHSWQALFLHEACCSTRTFSQPVFSGREGILPVAYRDPSGPDNATANQIYFYVTHDGGATWGEPRIAPVGFAPVGDDLSITILDSQHIWVTSQSLTGGDNVQTGPSVARTVDGGISWTVTHQTWRILQMTFRDATHGFALDVTGDQNVNGILSTSDGGATWQRVNLPVFG